MAVLIEGFLRPNATQLSTEKYLSDAVAPGCDLAVCRELDPLPKSICRRT